jgi:hypothetical protein
MSYNVYVYGYTEADIRHAFKTRKAETTNPTNYANKKKKKIATLPLVFEEK